MNTRLTYSFRHVMYNLRGGFLVRPLIIALALGCAGALLSALEEAVPSASAWLPTVLFPSRTDVQMAQGLLGAIAASMMTVVSIVFAILLMTLTLASMQFSPRIIVSFAQDRVTQWTLGVFLGTFLYCVAALPAARSVPRPFAPAATVAGAMLLALACVAWLLFFIHHISQAISVNHIVETIASETEAVIDQMMPHSFRRVIVPSAGHPGPSGEEAAVVSRVSGYVRLIDIKRLVTLAKSYGISVRVLRRVGHFVPAGVPLLVVSRAERLSPERSEALCAAFDLGPSRTLQQDVEFGILQIVDIALKAISPAVNDPSTAISCVITSAASSFASPPASRRRRCSTIRRGSCVSASPGSASSGWSTRPWTRSASTPEQTSRSACGCCAPWRTSPRRSRTRRFATCSRSADDGSSRDARPSSGGRSWARCARGSARWSDRQVNPPLVKMAARILVRTLRVLDAEGLQLEWLVT